MSESARVRMHAGTPLVTDGPFAETKEVVAGFWIVDVGRREEAIDIARRCPHARHGVVEVHAVGSRQSVADAENGTPFPMVFGREHGLTDPGGSKLRAMLEFGEMLKREGKFVESAPLALDPPPARVEPRPGGTLVTDGPFAEAKEVVGGYGLVRVGARGGDRARETPSARQVGSGRSAPNFVLRPDLRRRARYLTYARGHSITVWLYN